MMKSVERPQTNKQTTPSFLFSIFISVIVWTLKKAVSNNIWSQRTVLNVRSSELIMNSEDKLRNDNMRVDWYIQTVLLMKRNEEEKRRRSAFISPLDEYIICVY